VAPLPGFRSYHAAVAMESSKYVIGGRLDHSATSTDLKLDSVQGTGSEVAPVPYAHGHLVGCALGSDIYVFGSSPPVNHRVPLLKYDAVANTWSILAPLPFIGRGLSLSVIDGISTSSLMAAILGGCSSRHLAIGA
jgi:hypothetical protein